jgi:hypothetical protein
MKVFGQLEKAQLENTDALTATSPGRIGWNATKGKVEIADGVNVRAVLRNDDKCVLGNSGTDSDNVRLHRAGTGLLQPVLGSDTTAEGSLSANPASLVAGNITASAMLKPDGDLNIPLDNEATTGNISALSTAGKSAIRFNGASAVTVQGIANGADGKCVVFHNVTGNDLTVKAEDTNALTANRVAGSDVVIKPDATASFQYDATTQRWRAISGGASGGGGGLSTVEVTADTTIAAGKRYIVNGASQIVMSIPSSMSLGGEFQVFGKGAGGWKIANASGQTIHDGLGDSATGTDGGMISGHKYATAHLVCGTANTDFWVLDKNGPTALIGAFQGATKGYWAGGRTSGPSWIGSVDKITFSSETCAQTATNLSQDRSACYGASATLKGYVAGGTIYGGSYVNTITALTFSTDGLSNLAATLNTASAAGCSTSSVSKGFFFGGTNGSTLNKLEDINFSDESSNQISASLATQRFGAHGLNAGAYGYASGGHNGSGGIASVEKLTYATEGVTAVTSTFSASLYGGAPASSTAKGFVMAGVYGGSNSSGIRSFTFADESIATLSSTISAPKSNFGGLSAVLKGYAAGGQYYNTIDALTFSTEGCSIIAATLSSAKDNTDGTVQD